MTGADLEISPSLHPNQKLHGTFRNTPEVAVWEDGIASRDFNKFQRAAVLSLTGERTLADARSYKKKLVENIWR